MTIASAHNDDVTHWRVTSYANMDIRISMIRTNISKTLSFFYGLLTYLI